MISRQHAKDSLHFRARNRPDEGRWFLAEKPTSVVDAERRANVGLMGNCLQFVAQFRIPASVPYLIGPVWHAAEDLSRPAEQVYVSRRWVGQVQATGPAEVLRQDATFVRRHGHA